MSINENPKAEWIYPIKQFIIEDFRDYLEFDKNVMVKNLNTDSDKNTKYAIVVTEIFNTSIYLASRVITSFRLQKAGSIGYDTLLENHIEVPLSNRCVYGLPSRNPKDIADDYAITGKELADVVDRYKKISTFIDAEDKQPYSIIILALSRFNRTYDEMYIEDTLIDLMICFETLFTTINDNSKSEPLAKLATALLRNLDEIKTHKMYWILKQAYKIRNSLVHDGMRYPKGTITIEGTNDVYSDSLEFLRDVKEHARFCLREYVKILGENNTLTSTVLKGIIRQSL